MKSARIANPNNLTATQLAVLRKIALYGTCDGWVAHYLRRHPGTQLWSKTVAAVDSGELKVGRAAKFTLTNIERRNGGKTLKHFSIETKDATPEMVTAAASGSTDEPF